MRIIFTRNTWVMDRGDDYVTYCEQTVFEEDNATHLYAYTVWLDDIVWC